MNTTTLIAEWNMRGAQRDVAGRFRSSVDIRALLGAEPAAEAAPRADSLLVKSADEDDWRPLVDGD